MIRDVRCPDHQCSALLFKMVDGQVQVKCKRCKTPRTFSLTSLSTAWSAGVR